MLHASCMRLMTYLDEQQHVLLPCLAETSACQIQLGWVTAHCLKEAMSVCGLSMQSHAATKRPRQPCRPQPRSVLGQRAPPRRLCARMTSGSGGCCQGRPCSGKQPWPWGAARAHVVVVGRLHAEEVRQEHLLALQRVHLALGAPVPQQADGEEDGCACIRVTRCFSASG